MKTTCLYEQSKYYISARKEPTSIIEPISFNNLYGSDKTKQTNNTILQSYAPKINFKQLTPDQIKIAYDRSISKTLSYRTNQMSPELFIQQYLKLSELQRKNEYLSGSGLEFIRNEDEKLFNKMRAHYFPIQNELEVNNFQRSLIELSQMIYQSNIDPFQIDDYGTSKFIIFAENSNIQRIDFLYDAANRKLLGEDVQIIRAIHAKDSLNKQKKQNKQYSCLKNMKQFGGPKNFAALKQILQLINKINNHNKTIQPFYKGVHFYFADYSCVDQSLPLLRRQISHLPVLQYYLLMLTGILADNQSALLRLEGCFRHKTVEFLFFLKLIFNGKVTILKTLGSNPFTQDSYIYCEHYCKSHGKIIHKYLIANFGVLYKENGKGIQGLLQFFQNAEQQPDKKQEGDINDSKYLQVGSLQKIRNVKKGEQYLHIKEQSLLIDPKKIIKDQFPTSLSQFNDTIIYKGLQMNLRQFKYNTSFVYFPNKILIEKQLENKQCKNLNFILQKILKQEVVEDDKEKKKKQSEEKKQTVMKQADHSVLQMLSEMPVHTISYSKLKQKEKFKQYIRPQVIVFSEGNDPLSEPTKPKSAMEMFLQKCELQKQEEAKKKIKSKSKNKNNKDRFQ